MIDPAHRNGGQGARTIVQFERDDIADVTPRDLREMTAESISYLRAIVRSCPEGRAMGNGIAAASRVLEYARWREEWDKQLEMSGVDPEQLLAQLLGDERKLLTWMRAQLPRLEAKLSGAARGAGRADDETAE